jgi:hypothetical protein
LSLYWRGRNTDYIAQRLAQVTPPPVRVTNTRCIEFSKRGAARGALPIAGKDVPLLGKQRLDPIDYRAHAGGAAKITVDNDPVFGRDFGVRRSRSVGQLPGRIS